MRLRSRLAVVLSWALAMCLAGCHVQWVSPYSADLQKKATDMLSEVAAWEAKMRAAAGTAAADPRHPDVKAQLAKWAGEIEAMAQIQISIDPGSTGCDAVLRRLNKIPDALRNALPKSTAAASSSIGAPVTHCETLPNIFTRMTKQVSGDTADNAGIPFILDQQCKLPWLTDQYFLTLQEARATAGAPTAAAQAPTGQTKPTPLEQAAAVSRCRPLFVPPTPETTHGPLVDSLIIDLDAIIYREGRQAPPPSK